MGLSGIGQWVAEVVVTEGMPYAEESRKAIIHCALRNAPVDQNVTIRVRSLKTIEEANNEKAVERTMDDSMVVFRGLALSHFIGGLRQVIAIDDFAHEIAVAYDPLDKAIKFKVDNGPWSPPYTARQPEA